MSAARQWSLILALAGCVPALAGAANLEDALRRCARETEPSQRLACLDAVVATLPKLEADRFGMTSDIQRKRDPAPPQEPARPEVLTGRIAALGQAPHGEWIFTLDNQQVWLAMEVKPSIEFAIGEAVHIQHGAMSSLWLVADRHRRVRVKRLQ